ncbi:MAG: hypothetical protein K2X81_20255 [Candidatus Obscuribacterales bacterium]|nr:hypothetical protein [Candidatus Obscuribacterales bacterium]
MQNADRRVMASRLKLTLFVTPRNSSRALANLYRALSIVSYTDYELSIVDVLQEPDKAKQANITKTPCLCHHADDGDKLIESLADTDSVRLALGI